MAEDDSIVGVDVGATLCKLVRVRNGALDVARFAAHDFAAIGSQIRQWEPRCIGATGGGADRLGTTIAGIAVAYADEFSAWGRGATLIAAREAIALPAEHVVVSVGTGTSILAVRHGQVERVGGTALGGGTMLGLGHLLTACDEFGAFVALAADGDRRRVDLLIGDLYRSPPLAVLRDLSAANFAKRASRAPADLAHAIIGMVGENVALLATAHARGAAIQPIVYCGSTVQDNAPLRAVLEQITTVFGQQALFLEQGAYCGALGAAVGAAE